MIDEIPEVGSGKTLEKVGETTDLLVAFANAFRNATFVESDDDQWNLDITDGNVEIQYPNNLGSGGGKGDLQVIVAVNGALYFTNALTDGSLILLG